MYVGIALHAVLLPGWLTTLGAGIHKAARDGLDGTASLSDSRSEVSDEASSAGALQRNRLNGP